jgi:hypothetical protein
MQRIAQMLFADDNDMVEAVGRKIAAENQIRMHW